MNKIVKEAKLLFIVGPTASGKTALSIEVAREIKAEIICADSQTIRKDMNIGTAKPTVREMGDIRHHMLDIIKPYDKFSLYDFLHMARPIINHNQISNKNTIVVGGTGLYIDALYYNYELPALGISNRNNRENNDIIARSDLVKDNQQPYSSRTTRSVELGLLTIDQLQKIISDNGYKMPANYKNRRHLENVIKRGGDVGAKTEPNNNYLIVGINPGKDLLKRRIDDRINCMINNGFFEEVKQIIEIYGRPPYNFDAIGYKLAMRFLDGEINLEKFKELFSVSDRQYAKRQLTWFKRNKNIHWFSSPQDAKEYILSNICTPET